MYLRFVHGEAVAGSIAMQFLVLHKAKICIEPDGDGFMVEVEDDHSKDLDLLVDVNGT